MKKLRILALLLAAITVSVAFTGCRKTAADSSTGSAQAFTSETASEEIPESAPADDGEDSASGNVSDVDGIQDVTSDTPSQDKTKPDSAVTEGGQQSHTTGNTSQASSTQQSTSSSIGDSWWELKDGTLTISVKGDMPDYSIPERTAPWSEYLENIKKVVVKDGATSVGNAVFAGCKKLKSVTLPSGITKIGKASFLNCYELTSVTIPSSVEIIDDGAFSSCRSLTSITIPSSVKTIGEGAFERCEALTSITIPSGVTKISMEAFFECTGLTSVTIPSSVTEISYNIFKGCSSLKSIYFGGSEEQWKEISSFSPVPEGATVYYNSNGN